MKKRLRDDRGQTLIEVLAGLTIAVLIVTALVNMVTAGLRSSQFAKNSSQATKYGQEGIEWLRARRDEASWADFIAAALGDPDNKRWCLKNTAGSWPSVFGSCGDEDYICYGSCSVSEKTIFKREIYIEKDGDTRVYVKATVKWKDQASQEHNSILETKFSDTSKWH